LFPGEGAGNAMPLPEPLCSMAVGLRALPPLARVAEDSLQPGMWCHHAPLWSNPLVVKQEMWDWFGQQRQVAVGLECVTPGLLSLPQLQSVGQLAHIERLLSGLARMHPHDLGALQAGYEIHVWPLLGRRQQYSTWQQAHADEQRLISYIPPFWLTFLHAELDAQSARAEVPPVVTDASLQQSRDMVCGCLGWRLPNGTAVRLQDLTVRQGTQLQVLPAHVAIAPRHASFVSRVRAFDGLPPTAPLPHVCRVLSRWWRLRVPNLYKESAWRVTLDAFPTACRMGLLQSPCVACGVLGPDVGHHFWSCEVAQAVRQEVAL